MHWKTELDQFGRLVLAELGYDSDFLPEDHNPILRALEQPNFVEQFGDLKGFSRASLARVITVCQMKYYDCTGGPEQDGKPKALRRHWYSYWKTKFAQPLSEQLGEDLQSERWGLNWSARLSQTYAKFVDNGGGITYRDLWVSDASRMMAKNWETLFSGCHIIVAVEKDSLFADFTAPAKALGAKSVYSGKGKSSKAAIEKCLREHFGWSGDYNPFSADDPLIILHISDHDFDGEAVIGPTFGEQARRYTEHILEARIGIKPETVVDLGHDPREKWYQIKVSNKGYERWAAEKALFLDEWDMAVQGKADFDKDLDIAHGYEVEALRTRDYYGLLVDALLQVLPFDYIVSRLRDECKADPYRAAESVAQDIYAVNESYQALLKEFERLETIKSAFENETRNQLEQLGNPHIEDWRGDDDDPKPADFVAHVEDANDWINPWRPFDQRARTAKLIEWLEKEAKEEIEKLTKKEIEF